MIFYNFAPIDYISLKLKYKKKKTEKIRLCKIYNDRPLFCYLFPFSLHTVHIDCPGLSNIFPNKGKSEKEREKELNRQLSKNKLFWAFKIATLLFIISRKKS